MEHKNTVEEEFNIENAPLSDPKMSPHSDPQMTDPQMLVAVGKIVELLNSFKRRDKRNILNSVAALLE